MGPLGATGAFFKTIVDLNAKQKRSIQPAWENPCSFSTTCVRELPDDCDKDPLAALNMLLIVRQVTTKISPEGFLWFSHNKVR